ncbi:hypothetical protein GQ54DRAFT_330493 [Martensiomyces pterosporus]|nr:hypothetical protein GQ54DRAFT_330493 [Martensiomyces pterosporus]
MSSGSSLVPELSVSLGISFLAFLYGLFVIRIRRSIWHSWIFQILLTVQIVNCLRFIFLSLAVVGDVHVEFGCRWFIFLTSSAATLSVYLSVSCLLYLQLVVIHKVSPARRLPRIVLLVLSVVCSVVPNITYLVISHRASGIQNFCNVPRIPSHRQYMMMVFSNAIWVYTAGLVGLSSMAIVTVHIAQTSWRAKRLLQTNASTYQHQDSPEQHGHENMLNKTLRSVVWFPLTPIMSLWFNQILASVHYYTRRRYLGLEYLNIALLMFQSIFLAIALVDNPSVRHAFLEGRQKRSRVKQNTPGSERCISCQPSSTSSELSAIVGLD